MTHALDSDRADWYCDYCGRVIFGESHQVTLDHRIGLLCSTCYVRGLDDRPESQRRRYEAGR